MNPVSRFRMGLFLLAVCAVCLAPRPAYAQAAPAPKAPPAQAAWLDFLVLTPKGPEQAIAEFHVKRGAVLTPQVKEGLAGIKAASKAEGVYQAEVAFDFEAFAQEQQRRADLARRGAMVPIFNGRMLTGLAQVEFVKPSLIREALRLRIPLKVPPGVLNGAPITIDPSRELMITDLSVVEDPTRTFDPCTGNGNPTGAWTFGKLMTDMANGTVDPAQMVEDWLNLWSTDQTVNSFTVPNRAAGINSQLLSTWPRVNGKLDLTKSPMRLLAIVNRIDLRENTIYGGGSAGEGRFVFGVVNPAACSFGASQFTVILEYGVPISGCQNIHAWGQKWHALGSIVMGSAGFNPALQAITDVFAGPNANPSKPNGSALDQLRTNEVALAFPWELREFHLDGTSHELVEFTVKQTPELSFNMTSTVTDYVNGNQAAILAGTYLVPNDFPAGSPFLGANAPNGPPTVFWNGATTPTSNDARQQFSLGTCNGCHGSETATGFLQIHPRAAGAVAQLSQFLLGNGTLASPNTITVSDPVSGVPRSFGDLLRRQQDLDALLGSSCRTFGPFRGLLFKPLNMTH